MSDFIQTEIFSDEYRDFSEFDIISSFNELKGKEFMTFKEFKAAMIKKQAKSESKDLSNKTKLVLVSGVPGSGKSTLGWSLVNFFSANGDRVTCFSQDVKHSLEFQCKSFLEGLVKCKKSSDQVDIIIAVLPGYHHLKKVCFELNKEPEFKEHFSLQFVITKVSTKHFYLTKHRNIRQFLLENCLKGICDCVILERGFYP